MTTNEKQQTEEIEALVSIYDSIWQQEKDSDHSYSIQINSDVKLFISLTPDYPSDKPPEYQLLAPTLTRNQKEQIHAAFDTIYGENCGEPVLFQWIEKLKELVLSENSTEIDNDATAETVNDFNSGEKMVPANRYEIIHGSIIQDRKSTFQGHACSVKSHEEIKEVLGILLENKKLAQATHNILAYRIITNPSTGTLLQDYDDDGEYHAGGRVLHLLQILNVINVMVVVTRWYGGIHLGPDRFRHINNAARQVLQQGGFIKNDS